VSERPAALNLANWRLPPNAGWAFQHVREIVPSELIERGDETAELPRAPASLEGFEVTGPEGEQWSLAQWMDASQTDALLVAHRGRLVHEWYAEDEVETNPHIVFSVSKSITATLAGVLVGKGLLDPSRPVVETIPELADSGYRDATLQQVLDMTVSIDFNEDYLATSGKFIEYRTATAWYPCEVDAIDQGLHQFLCGLQRAEGEHGEAWQYKSPNSDLLGWVLERAAGERLANLMSRYLWQPLGAEKDAYITVDRKGAARTAGGICVVPRDLLRFAELVRNRGGVQGRQVIPASWIDDCSQGGSREAWQRGESAKDFPDGRYRNKWYQTGNEHQALLAIGIHSQWIYVNPVTEVAIVKLSSQDLPLRLELDDVNIRAFTKLSDLASGREGRR
jgi:CubicO group peptidase (beta-lactamase class C family)